MTHRTLHLSEHRDEWWLPLSALGPYAVLLRVTTAAPRRFRPLRVEPVEPPATDTERAILDTVEEAGYTLVPAAEAAVTVTVPDSTGEPVNRPLYQVLFDTVPGSDGELPWR
ncbi:hypothetical protein ACIRYZ_19225 [Kitasatospora sp. NPDC101155]|uniref:hypothetical protein n=1 Tax=Kitasatospora sp. NPDC101155 TaxID=3364097 RepID=UPI003803B9EC